MPRPTARQQSTPLSARPTHDRRHWLLIERGFRDGPTSLIALSLEVEAGALRKATIVGASGALEL